jgi:hypothetical protein
MTDELERIWKEEVMDPGEAHDIHKTPVMIAYILAEIRRQNFMIRNL